MGMRASGAASPAARRIASSLRARFAALRRSLADLARRGVSW